MKILWKKLSAFICIVTLCAATSPAVFARDSAAAPASAPASELTIDARAALIMEPETGKVLLEQNAHTKLAPASVTKVMTLLLIYEAVDDGRVKWDDIVTISEHAAGMGGSQVYLEVGERQNVRDLVKCVAVASANDASVALAEFISGSEETFVIRMNDKAAELGMRDTTFKNACGLDTPGHVTSAYDIALMTRELMQKYPMVHEFATIWMDSIVHKTARGEEEFGLSNTNRLLKNYTGTTGMKTGSTADALYCISATAKRDEMELIAVILGAPNPTTRFQEAMKLLDYGFANYSVTQGEEAGTVKAAILVRKGQKEELPVAIRDQVSMVVSKGNKSKLESRIELVEALVAPVAQGAKAGEIIYTFEGNEVGRSDLVTTVGTAKAGLGDQVVRLARKWTQN